MRPRTTFARNGQGSAYSHSVPRGCADRRWRGSPSTDDNFTGGSR